MIEFICEIPQSIKQVKEVELISFILPQKLKHIQDYSEQFEQPNMITIITIDEILKQNFPIVIFGLSGQRKSTLARQIKKQIKKIDQKQEIKAILISAKNKIQSDWTSLLSDCWLKKSQQFNIKHDNDQIENVIIIDDFEFILLQNQELLEKIKGNICQAKCKFIYFINESIRQIQVYKDWIHHESQLNKYQMMQLNKSDVKNYFEQYIPWDQCLSNIDLSQDLNKNIIKSIIGKKIQNNQNIHNVLIKIIKLSSIVNDLEQEAGNAMMILKELKCILQNQDFSFIRIKNSNFDFLSFHKCNFQGSQMENVDISRCWFISCNLNNVYWHNMVKHELQFKYNIFQNRKVESVVFSNDNQLFAVGFGNLTIELWHIKACKRLAILRNDKNNSNFHSNYVSITFSSNRILMVSSAHSAKLNITSCLNGKIIRKLNQMVSDYQTCPITFTHDNQLLAVGLKEIIYIWNLDKGQKIIEFKGHSGEIRELKFSEDDKLLASCCQDQTIITWNIKEKQQQKFQKILKEFSQKFYFSPDLKYLAAIESRQNFIVVLNIISEVQISKNLYNINEIVFSSNGKYIACGLTGGAVTLFELINQTRIKTRTQSKSDCFDIVEAKDWNQYKISDSYEKNEILSLKFSTSQSYLISGNSEGTIKFHDFQDKNKLEQNGTKFYCLAFSSSGKILAFGSYVKEVVFIWDMEQGKLLTELTPKAQKKECFRSIAFSFDEQLLAYCYDHRIMLWNLKTRELMSNIEHEEFVQEAIFSPTESVLASCCSDRFTIFIWDVETPKQVVLKKRIISCNIINQIAYSPCGNFLAQGGLNYLCIWNIQSQKDIKIFETKDDNKCYRTINFSPDGTVLASGAMMRLRYGISNREIRFQVSKKALIISNFLQMDNYQPLQWKIQQLKFGIFQGLQSLKILQFQQVTVKRQKNQIFLKMEQCQHLVVIMTGRYQSGIFKHKILMKQNIQQKMTLNNIILQLHFTLIRVIFPQMQVNHLQKMLKQHLTRELIQFNFVYKLEEKDETYL